MLVLILIINRMSFNTKHNLQSINRLFFIIFYYRLHLQQQQSSSTPSPPPIPESPENLQNVSESLLNRPENW